jgi:hypothetical protein
MVAITNDVFMEFPLPAPLYRAKLFLMSRGGDEVQGVNPIGALRQRLFFFDVSGVQASFGRT